MTEIFYSSPEQSALINECQKLADRFGSQPMLHGSASAIASARSLIERGSEAGIPTVAYVGLQMAVQMAEIDAQLPEEARQFRPLP